MKLATIVEENVQRLAEGQVQRGMPVTLGSPRSTSRELGTATLVHAWFPANATIDRHSHDYPVLAVMLRGSFDLNLSHRAHYCPEATVIVEPAGEAHENRMHRAGAEVVIVQPHPAASERWRAFHQLFAESAHLRHGGIQALGGRLALEISRDDPLAMLGAEAIAIEMLVCAARCDRRRIASSPPAWLQRVTDTIHDRAAGMLDMSTLATIAGVSPGHLARVFRRVYHTSIGGYARRARLERAITRLRCSRESIAVIAIQEGFADQSHLTRALRSHLGSTPGQLRRHST